MSKNIIKIEGNTSKIIIVIFEAGLELDTDNSNKKSTISSSKNYHLLDLSVNQKKLKHMPFGHKRGRPDIIHSSLLSMVYSPLFKSEKIEIIIHTREDKVIEIPNSWRAPVNYNRFCGLFSQLLQRGRVPIKGEPILVLREGSIKSLLDEFPDAKIILCDEKSKNKSDNLVDLINTNKKIIFLIGGYQKGEPETIDIEELLQNEIVDSLNLYDESVPAWVICGKIVYLAEELIKV